MLKMIIVDDERKIRESMKNCVDWEELGIRLIGLCKNGLEAYDMIIDESPDIVLTDIKMPALSGLELISRITQIGQHVQFIILSGYGEFVYTKEAMKYGIKHYLMKPCNEEELIAVVKDAANACYQWEKGQMAQQFNIHMLQNLKENVFQNLLTECFSDGFNDTLAERHSDQFFNLLNVSYEMLLFDGVDESHLVNVMRVVNDWQRELMPEVSMYCMYVENQLFLFLENVLELESEKLEQLNEKMNTCHRKESIPFKGLSPMMDYLKNMIPHNSSIKYQNGGRWVRLPIQTVIYAPEDGAAEKKEVDQTKNLQMIHTGKGFIDQTIRYVYDHLSNPELSLKLIAEKYLFMNVDYLSKQFSRYVGCKFSAFLANARIEEAKRLLVSRKDITVQEVAEAVGCGNNPQYFSLLFKKHTGSTATDYVKKMNHN